MKLQWFKYSSEVIIFFDYCYQRFLICSKKSSFSKKKIPKNRKFLRIFSWFDIQISDHFFANSLKQLSGFEKGQIDNNQEK